MEKTLTIRLSDGHSLYGKFSGSFRKPLFIIVHGMPGNRSEYFYKTAAFWFTKRGFSTFRFNLYDWRKNARQLIDCTLRTHADDLDAVVRYFHKRGVKHIFVAGHSYGGPTILLSKDQDFDAVSLWDPAYKSSFAKKRYGFPGGKYVKELGGYFMKSWGVNVVIGKKMAIEADTLKWDTLTQNFHAPVQIIAAGKGVLVKGARHYFKTANASRDLRIIRGATHYFDDAPSMQEEVCWLSERWFRRFL